MFSADATRAVVPDPMKGSSIVSSGWSLNSLMRFLTSSAEKPSLYFSQLWMLSFLLSWKLTLLRSNRSVISASGQYFSSRRSRSESEAKPSAENDESFHRLSVSVAVYSGNRLEIMSVKGLVSMRSKMSVGRHL